MRGPGRSRSRAWRDGVTRISLNSTCGGHPSRSQTHASRRRVGRHYDQRLVETTISRLSTYLERVRLMGNAMNRYGLQARSHWMTHAPSRYADLEDPVGFFRELGESAAAQIAELSAQLERDLPQDLPEMERVARMRSIQEQAEEVVLTDLIYSVPPESSSLAEELEDLLGQLPSASMIESMLERLQAEAEEEAEREGWSRVLLSEEQEEQHQRLTKLLGLVRLPQDPEQMSEAELSERIAALRPFLPKTDPSE